MFIDEKTRRVSEVTVFIICLVTLTSCLPEKDHSSEIADEKSSLAKRFFLDCFFFCPPKENKDSLWLKIVDAPGAGSPGACHMVFTDKAATKSKEIVVPKNSSSASNVDIIMQNTNEKYAIGDAVSPLDDLEKITIWTAKAGNGTDEWKPELVKVVQDSTGKVAYFPIDRWLTAGTNRTFFKYDTSLPQKDPLKVDREADLATIAAKYAYRILYDNVTMPRVINQPVCEQYSQKYILTMGLDKMAGPPPVFSTESFKSYQEMLDSYKPLPIPKYASMKFKEDEWFARSRLQGANPGVIRLAKEIPKNFNVTDGDIFHLLENSTIKDALARKKLFIVDYSILERFTEQYMVPTPFALFYLNSTNVLKPVAIQLYQKPAADNPVFTPRDFPNVWLLAKLWFHVSDTNYQQSIAHLGLTHFLIEGIIAVTHSTLSISHPLFKLLKPHFFYTIASNIAADQFVLAPGGLADKAMALTSKGILNGAGIGIENYNMSRDSIIPVTFKEKETTKDVLPEYPYRDDSIGTWNIIRKYVKSMLKLHYKKDEDFKNDKELKAWRLALHDNPIGNKPKGVGIKGIPGDDVKGFQNIDELIDVVTIIISIASIQHAAVNYIQYDWYGFAPNQPSIMNNRPPTTKDNVTDEYVLECLPNREQFMNIVIATKLLGTRGTNNLGDFETPRFYKPDAVAVVKRFQRRLKSQSASIVEKNKQRPEEYKYLIPFNVPNSIPI